MSISSLARPRNPWNARRRENLLRAATSEFCTRLEDRTLFALTISPYSPSTAVSALTSALVENNTGITVTSASYIGVDGQGGTYKGFDFNDGKTALSLNDGVILTDGLADNALGPNNNTAVSAEDGTAGDADLTKLIGGTATNDANVLTINFTTTAKTKSVAFDFVFGSDEFPEYVGAYNDAFGAYLDGKQISFDSNNKPITVNNDFFTLNNSTDTANPTVTAGKTKVNFDLQYDGLTPELTTKGALDTTKTTHTLKLAIADAGDEAVDSGIFLSQLRGDDTSGGVTAQPPVAKAGGPYTVTAGGTVVLNGTGSTDPAQSSSSLTYSWDLDGDGVFGETGTAAANGNETGSKPTFSAAGLKAGTVKTVTLKVTNAEGLSSTSTAQVTVTAPTATTSIVATPPANQTATATVGKNFSLGSFSETNATGPYTVDINWGDKTADTKFTTTTVGTIAAQAHTYAVAGSDTVSVVITDSASHTSNKATFLVTVSSLPVTTGSISGLVVADDCGNGIIADGTALSGATIDLYTDANGDGKVDGTDKLVITATTGASGKYSFPSLSAGSYVVAEVVPAGDILTAPATGDSYAVNLTAGESTTENFADFKKPTSTGVSGIVYHVGAKSYTSLKGVTAVGETVSVTFTVTNPAGEKLSLVSYTAPDAKFVAADAAKQKVYQDTSATYAKGTYTLTIKLPPTGHFQVDFVTGCVITQFGSAGSNIFYSMQNRLLSSDNE